VKTAAFFAAALPHGARCWICGALIHKNSVNFDHAIARRDKGPTETANARVSHPYCNSAKTQLLTQMNPALGPSAADGAVA
jgi:5-methylcytosine-specific restriction endonuclease McrA